MKAYRNKKTFVSGGFSWWLNRLAALITHFLPQKFEVLAGIGDRRSVPNFYIPEAFYRPFLKVGNFAFWGRRILNLRLPLDSVRKVHIAPSSSGQFAPSPVGFILNRAVPDTRFEIRRLTTFVPPAGASLVAVGDNTKPCAVIAEPTKSYFHFVTEILPICLAYSNDFRVVIPIWSEWQRAAIAAFEFPGPIEELFDPFQIGLEIFRKIWGLYPAAEPLLVANRHLLRRYPMTLQSKKVFVTRTRASSSTGRIASAELEDRFRAMNFEVIEASSISVRSQLELFRHAYAVGGPHGSSFGSLVAATEGTRVVEVDGPRVFHHHVERICSVLGLSYVLVPAVERATGLSISDHSGDYLKDFFLAE